jgi:hypothetical protein
MTYPLNNLLAIAGDIISDPSIKANATISFSRIIPDSTPTFTTDSKGRQVPAEGSSEVVELTCWLREARVKRDNPQMQEGADLNATYFEGRLVDPKTYDFPIKANSPITVTVNGRTGTMLVDTRMLESPTSQQYDIKGQLGQRLAIFVQFKQNN